MGYSDALIDECVEVDVEIIENRYFFVAVTEITANHWISVFEPGLR